LARWSTLTITSEHSSWQRQEVRGYTQRWRPRLRRCTDSSEVRLSSLRARRRKARRRTVLPRQRRPGMRSKSPTPFATATDIVKGSPLTSGRTHTRTACRKRIRTRIRSDLPCLRRRRHRSSSRRTRPARQEGTDLETTSLVSWQPPAATIPPTPSGDLYGVSDDPPVVDAWYRSLSPLGPFGSPNYAVLDIMSRDSQRGQGL
jgi:hypothetical protein